MNDTVPYQAPKTKGFSWILLLLAVIGYVIHFIMLSYIDDYGNYFSGIYKEEMRNGNYNVPYESWESGTYSFGIVAILFISYPLILFVSFIAAIFYSEFYLEKKNKNYIIAFLNYIIIFFEFIGIGAGLVSIFILFLICQEFVHMKIYGPSPGVVFLQP